MTDLLEKAFERASQLPESEQDALARWMLEELGSEKKWEEVFSRSPDLLETMADEALEEDRKGKTRQLNANEM